MIRKLCCPGGPWKAQFSPLSAYFIGIYSDAQSVKMMYILLILCLIFDVFIEMLCGKIKHKNLFM